LPGRRPPAARIGARIAIRVRGIAEWAVRGNPDMLVCRSDVPGIGPAATDSFRDVSPDRCRDLRSSLAPRDFWRKPASNRKFRCCGGIRRIRAARALVALTRGSRIWIARSVGNRRGCWRRHLGATESSAKRGRGRERRFAIATVATGCARITGAGADLLHWKKGCSPLRGANVARHRLGFGAAAKSRFLRTLAAILAGIVGCAFGNEPRIAGSAVGDTPIFNWAFGLTAFPAAVVLGPASVSYPQRRRRAAAPSSGRKSCFTVLRCS